MVKVLESIFSSIVDSDRFLLKISVFPIPCEIFNSGEKMKKGKNI
jgi:hypothetical protein